MLLLPAALAALISLPAPATPPERVAATPVPEATAIRIDGELNDAVWQNVPPITSFRQREPRDNGEPTFQTEARVAYDATALYIAVRALDPQPQKIVGIRTRRDEDGWRAEFKIPFSQLRFHPAESATFGLAVVRMVGRLNETDTWPLISKSATGVVSSFGELTGLRLNRAAKRLEVVP